MSTSRSARTLLALSAAAAVTLGLSLAPGAAAATGSSSWSLSNVGKYGGEPSLTVDPHGVLYDTTPSGGTITYRSVDGGATWQPTTTADPSSGDDCVTTDQTGAVYECNLAGSAEAAPLQADVWKSTNGGQTWTQGAAIDNQQSTCGTSCQPFGVDRDWLAATILSPNTTSDKAEVALMYHDFYGPSSIWVNLSTDGGKTFGASTNVLAPPAATAGAVTGSLTAEGYSFCSTVPAGVGIVPSGAHKGRIIVGWIASDAAEDAAGCNVSQYESFHTAWVSYSDDGGATWTPQLAYDAGIGHDMSTPFVGFTIDSAGNPYFAFATDGGATAPTCGAESTAGTLQSDATCSYNMYVVGSKDQGTTFGDGAGTIPGSASTAYQVNAPALTGTAWFPAIAVANPGQVAVAFLHTSTILPTGPTGKADPGGCAAAGSVNQYAAGPCKWELYTGSATLAATPAATTWDVSDVTGGTPMHVGDICNLGIACVGSAGSNRNLLDFIQESIDPTTGCAHVAYSDDNTVKMLRAANQSTGCFDLTAAGADLPETSWPVILVPLAALTVLAVSRRTRGRRRTA